MNPCVFECDGTHYPVSSGGWLSNQPLHHIVIHLCIKQMEKVTGGQEVTPHLRTHVATLRRETPAVNQNTHWNTPLFQMQDQVSQIKHAYVVFAIFYLYIIDI